LMALAGHAVYHDAIRSTLLAALCIRNFPSPTVERHNKPEIEVKTSPELILNPLIISKDKDERVMIETSVNSVRISITWKKSDETDTMLAKRFSQFLALRASQFHILRRKPLPGWDISFLITNAHLETMLKHKLVDWMIDFIQEIGKDMKDMKIALNPRARTVAREFLQTWQ